MKQSMKKAFWILLFFAIAIGTYMCFKSNECEQACPSHDGGSFDFQEWRCYCVDKTPLNYYKP